MTGANAADRELIRRHLVRMRSASAIVALSIPAAAVAVFLLPHDRHTVLGPTVTTLLAGAAALWIGASANRDARVRLERVKRAFAVHGNLERLLRDHVLVYVVVLARLDLVAVCGLVAAVWGNARVVGLALIALAGILIATTWPTEHKTRLLIDRAHAMLEP